MKTALFVLLAAAAVAQDPVLDRLVGTWSQELRAQGRPPIRMVLHREPSTDGSFLRESVFDGNGRELGVAFWTYDAGREVYQRVGLRASAAVLWEGPWDADTKTLKLDVWTQFPNQSGWVEYSFGDAGISIRYEWRMGDRVWSRTGQADARDRQPTLERRARSSQVQVLNHFFGRWSSEIGGHRNSSTSAWSAKGKGNFLVTKENGVDGGEKYSAMTWDPHNKIYLGVFLEPGSAGFLKGTWNTSTQTMQREFLLFERPRDENGEFLPGSLPRDGIHGLIKDQVVHKYRRELYMRIQVGGERVWQGSGRATRSFAQDRVWPLSVKAPAGQAIVINRKFARDGGKGATLRLDSAEEAIRVLPDGPALRSVAQLGYNLHVPNNRFEEGTSIILWHKIGQTNIHGWTTNEDASLSPLQARELALGHEGERIILVQRDDERRLVFPDAKRSGQP